MSAQVIRIGARLLPADAPHLSALDRGFSLGDGVFTTLRLAGGRPFRLADHLARLRANAALLDLPVPWSDAELAAAVADVAAANGLPDAAVRITVSRGVPSERGLLPPTQPAPTLVVQASPYHALPPERLARGFALATSAIRRNETSPTSRAKTCSYLDGVLARLAAARAGADEALLLSSGGYLACCSAANVHLLADGRIRTPAGECGVLAGVGRLAVRELAGARGLDWEEGWLAPAELAAADEVFLTNSLLGVVPVVRVDGRPVGGGRPGPVALRLRHELEAAHW